MQETAEALPKHPNTGFPSMDAVDIALREHCFFASHINTFYPNINFDYSGSDDTTNKKVKFVTRNGLLILFPSQITHSTDKTLSTKYRYSLAFNMFCKGKFGKDEYELEIK